MYYENANKTFNIWRDIDTLHVFVNTPSKKYSQFSKTLDYVKKILCMNFHYEYDGTQIYFTLSDFNELNELKTYFYRYLVTFKE